MRPWAILISGCAAMAIAVTPARPPISSPPACSSPFATTSFHRPGASMPEYYSVRLDKEYLVFSAAHFITFNGNTCERLHGHNYRVRAEIHGPLDVNHYVIDFIALRDSL